MKLRLFSVAILDPLTEGEQGQTRTTLLMEFADKDAPMTGEVEVYLDLEDPRSLTFAEIEELAIARVREEF